MINQVIPKYETLPTLTTSQISQLQQSGKMIVFYDELVIDVTTFNHPGSQSVFSYFTSSMHESFIYQKHSYNAKLMLCHLTIGKVGKGKGQGYILMNQIKQSERSIIHEKILSNLDFAHPLLPQLQKLTPEQQEIFTAIPKFYDKNNLRFLESRISDYLYKDRFWLGTSYFIVVWFCLLLYLLTSGTIFNSLFKVMLFLFGVAKWTIIEYYFHRFELHVPFAENKIMNGHYIHHSFPGFKDKIALSPTKTTIYQILFYFFYTKVTGLSTEETLHILLGTHLLLITYDCLHYYFHHGPQINIRLLKKLKKNHLKHHFRDQNRGFGVTNTFWDWVFGTSHVN